MGDGHGREEIGRPVITGAGTGAGTERPPAANTDYGDDLLRQKGAGGRINPPRPHARSGRRFPVP